MRRFELRRIASYALCLVIGFVFGTWLGGWQERVRQQALGLAEAVGRSFFLSQHADLQFCEADYEAAHEALLGWLSHLDQSRPVGGEYRDPLMTARGLAVDKTLALGRLALLEERRGQTDLAKDYWRRAEGEAKLAAWKDATELGVRVVVERTDNCDRPTAKP